MGLGVGLQLLDGLADSRLRVRLEADVGEEVSAELDLPELAGPEDRVVDPIGADEALELTPEVVEDVRLDPRSAGEDQVVDEGHRTTPCLDPRGRT